MIILTMLAAGAHAADELPEGRAWSNYLIPLPQELAVSGEVRLAPGQVGLATAPDASVMVVEAVNELRAAYQARSGQAPTGTDFMIYVGRLDEQGRLNGQVVTGAERLKQTRFPDQAYLIRPSGTNGLLVAGWHDKGVFYAVQTLSQLLLVRTGPDMAVAPLAEITDWPDMDERGPWNIEYAAPGFIPWLAALKLNLTICKPRPVFQKGAPVSFPPGQIPLDQIREAGQRAFLLLPHTPHPDYFCEFGFTNAFPELVGQGDSAIHHMAKLYPSPNQFEQCRAPCASNPGFAKVMEEMALDAANQGVRDLSIWLSEFTPQQCGCAECLRDGPRQFQLETQAGVAALMRVREKYPDFTGRICFTFLRMDDHYVKAFEECLAMIPPEGIRVEAHYSPKQPVLDYAVKGGWVSSYDGLFLNRTWSRFDLGSDMRHSVSNLLSKHYSGVVCLDARNNAEFSQVWGDFQYHTLAEWSWNVRGRSPQELAAAWATRRGLANPEKFGDWFAAFEPLAKTVRLYERSPGWEKILTAATGLPLPDGSPARAEIDRQWLECEAVMQLADAADVPVARHETRLIQANLAAMRLALKLHALLAPTAADTARPAPGELARIKADINQAWDNYVAAITAYGQILNLESNATFQQRLKALEREVGKYKALLETMGAA